MELRMRSQVSSALKVCECYITRVCVRVVRVRVVHVRVVRERVAPARVCVGELANWKISLTPNEMERSICAGDSQSTNCCADVPGINVIILLLGQNLIGRSYPLPMLSLGTARNLFALLFFLLWCAFSCLTQHISIFKTSQSTNRLIIATGAHKEMPNIRKHLQKGLA